MIARGYSPETLDEYDLRRQARAEARQLAAKLPQVFGNPRRPQITLRVARGIDDEWNLSDTRAAELEAQDSAYQWDEVTRKETETFQEYFCYADAAGVLFYLPAFLHHYLAEFPDGGYGAVVNACQRRDHFELVNSAQIALVDEFLALCAKWRL